MEFEQVFTAWLDSCFDQRIPDAVQAFSFNLYEPAGEPGVKFGIELIGAGMFDEESPDWPCKEVWEPARRRLSIPADFSGSDWESCLVKMKELVLNQIESNSRRLEYCKLLTALEWALLMATLK